MISRPWFQIFAFVAISNIVQVSIFASVADMTGSALAASMSMLFCCAIAVRLLVIPDSATTGHKMLTLTFGMATLYFAVLVSSGAFAMAGFLSAWYAYNTLHGIFESMMMTFTALELLSVFINTILARAGAAGDNIGRYIDNVYRIAVGGVHDSAHNKGV